MKKTTTKKIELVLIALLVVVVVAGAYWVAIGSKTKAREREARDAISNVSNPDELREAINKYEDTRVVEDAMEKMKAAWNSPDRRVERQRRSLGLSMVSNYEFQADAIRTMKRMDMSYLKELRQFQQELGDFMNDFHLKIEDLGKVSKEMFQEPVR